MKNPQSRYYIGATELGETISYQNTSIKLLGVNPLAECDDVVCRQVHDGDITEESCFCHKIGDGARFFYLVEHFFNSRLLGEWESGIGQFRIVDGEHIVDREIPLYKGEGNGIETRRVPQGGKPTVFHNRDGHIKVSSIAPATFMDLLAAPYSVIVSVDPYNPSPVELEENTLLGRKDDIIQSIDMGELKEMDGFSDAVNEIVSENQKQIKMKARRLDLTRKNSVMSAPVLRATPVYDNTEKPPAQQGMIIYNKDTRKLEFFDGMDWNEIG